MEKIPNVKFELMSIEEVSGILEWAIIIDEGILPISNYVFNLYPKLRKIENWKSFSANERSRLIEKMIYEEYLDELDEYNAILNDYQIIWKNYNDKFMYEMLKLLNIKNFNGFNEIVVKVGKIPVYPRDIEKHCFYIGGMEREYLIQTIMHECCHFLYFEKWKELYKNWKIEEFDSPHIIWYLSEMVIDPILNSPNIQKIYKTRFEAYQNFYKININGENLMDSIKHIYRENKIEAAIRKSYQFVLNNKSKIQN